MFKDEADFEKVVGRLNIDTEPNAAHRENLLRQMLSVFNKVGQKPATRIIVFRALRRTTMKSPITKIAAAAVIIIAVLISLNILGTSTPAFAEIVKPFLTARTASFKMTMEVEGVPTQTFDCLYAEPAHMRQTNNEQGAVVISDLQKGEIVTLSPAQKKAFVVELENMPDDEDQSQFNLFSEIRKRIREAQESQDASVEFIGEKKINGITVIGYHVQKPIVDITVWADPQTKLPVEMINKSGPTTYTMTDIVFDVELDESLFNLEIPDGYTVHTMQVDASEPTENDLINMFRIWAEHMDGNLPSALEMNAMMEFMQYQRKKMKEQGIEPTEKTMLELQKTIQKMSRGGMFVQKLPADSDWHYAGKGVKFGDADTAIFWYRPEGSETYRVIYGDLSVKDVAPQNLPQ
jgi:outer membrane lipoprotein-sorting protein